MNNDILFRAAGLRKRFGALTAVDDLSIDINAGEVFGFLGPNGAGKTTSLRMMTGLLRPDAGEIFFKGRRLDGSSALSIGLCPQEIVLWTRLTCLEQLVFTGRMHNVPSAEARARAERLLAEMGLQEKRNALAGQLSGGMQRRLNLILALVHDPELIVLDEPEAGLDPQSRVLVREYIRSLARKRTVIVTTHNLDEADRVCDRVGIIDRGKLLALDTPRRLKETAGEGDVLELTFREQTARGAELLAAFGALVSTAGPVVLARARGIVEMIPRILSALEQQGLGVDGLHVRSASLEDVFINLTGRRLRE